MSKPRYSVVTAIFGRGYEKLREVENPQPDVEYVCVTDDPDLDSPTWRVKLIRDIGTEDPFAKLFEARYRQFDFASSDTVVWIDGSIQLCGSLDPVVSVFEVGGYDLALMPHPFSSSIPTEYENWIKIRGYPFSFALNACCWILSQPDGNSIMRDSSVWQACFSIRRDCPEVRELDRRTLAAMAQISAAAGQVDRLDQTVFSAIVQQMGSQLEVLPVSEHIVRSDAMQWFMHGSDQLNAKAFYSPDWPDVKLVGGKHVETLMLRD